MNGRLTGCIIGFVVAVMLIIWFFLVSCDNWMMPGGWTGQYKAYRDCQKKGNCDVYNIMGSPGD